MAQEHIIGLTVQDIQVNINMVKSTVKEYLFLSRVDPIQDNG